jgi:hypothetical protein
LLGCFGGRLTGLGITDGDFDGTISGQFDASDVQADRSDRFECPLKLRWFYAPTTGTHGNVLVA